MRTGYDFRRARRGSVLPARGKTRITMYLDDDVLAAFRSEASTSGIGYQTLINESLRETLAKVGKNAGVDAVAEPLPGYQVLSGLEQRLVHEIRRVEGLVSGAARRARPAPPIASPRTAKRKAGRK